MFLFYLYFNRDNIYRLDLDDLKKIEAARWPATEEKVQLCLMKGQNVDDCHNYIKVLLSTGKRLFACGTGAFSPQCTWREVSIVTQKSFLTWGSEPKIVNWITQLQFINVPFIARVVFTFRKISSCGPKLLNSSSTMKITHFTHIRKMLQSISLNLFWLSIK